jgi:hypothetical protein
MLQRRLTADHPTAGGSGAASSEKGDGGALGRP